MKPKTKSLGLVCNESWLNCASDSPLYKTDWERAARAVIREYERRQWRPVSERPKKSGWIIIHRGGLVRWHYWTKGHSFDDQTTHWRPVPKGPKR
jgi:hypothetical protein